MRHIFLILLFSFSYTFAQASGCYNRVHDFVLYGGDNTGLNNNVSVWMQISNLISNEPQASHVIYFPAGTYLFDGGIPINNPVTIKGEGIGVTNINLGDSGFINHLSGRTCIKDLTIEYIGELDGSNKTLINGRGDYNIYDRVEIVGDASGLRIVDEANNWTITNCVFRGIRFCIWSSNDFVAGAKNWVISDNHFLEIKNSAFTPNSDSGIPHVWQNLSFCHNVLEVKDNSISPFGILIGGDNYKEVVISDNLIRDVQSNVDYPIHIENNCEDVVISNNKLTNVSSGIGVWSSAKNVVINGNVISSNKGRLTSDDPVDYLDETPTFHSNDKTTGGIHLIIDQDGQPNNIHISDNLIDGFDAGIFLGSRTFTQVLDNKIINCTYGIVIRDFLGKCEGNTIINNKDAFYFLNSNVNRIGKNMIDRCSNVFRTLTGSVLFDDLEIKLQKNLTAGNVSVFNIIPVPKRIDNNPIVFGQPQNNFSTSFYAETSLKIVDSALVSNTRDFMNNSGTSLVSNPPYDIDSGMLQARVFSASNNDVIYTIKIKDLLYF